MHQLGYELLYRPRRTPNALRIGTLVHRALEAWWRWWQTRNGESAIVMAMAALDAAYDDESDPYDRARMTVMIIGYDLRWSAFAESCEVLAVEIEFRIPLLHPVSRKPARTWKLAGKIDAVVRLPDGRVAVVEHKTSGSFDIGAGSDYRSNLTLDSQISQYFAGAEAVLGVAVDLCMYDVLVKPMVKPKKASKEIKLKKDKTPRAGQRVAAETAEEYKTRIAEAIAESPERYCVHAEIVRLNGEDDNHARNMWHTVRQIEDARRAGYWTQNPDACFKMGRCSFWGVCAGHARIDDEALYKKIDDPHAELGGRDDDETPPDNGG